MPFDDSNIKKMVKDQMEKKVAFSKSRRLSNEIKDLIHRILEVNVKKRASVIVILEHPWMKSSSGANNNSKNKQKQRVVEPLPPAPTPMPTSVPESPKAITKPSDNVVRLSLDFAEKKDLKLKRSERIVTTVAPQPITTTNA